MQDIDYYKKKYEMKVIDVSNSIELYNSFLFGLVNPLDVFIEAFINKFEEISVLDIGCGDGGFLSELTHKYKNVICFGVDLVDPLNSEINFFEGNFLNLNFDSKFDLVVSFRTLHEIGEYEKVMYKITNILSENGKCVLSLRVRDSVGNFVGSVDSEDEKFLLSLANVREFEKFNISTYLFRNEDRNFLEGAIVTIYSKLS